MPTIAAQFDGRVFVPTQKIDLPPGTKVEVVVPTSLRRPTEQEAQEWREILQEIHAAPPVFPSPEEALRQSRKRP
ncbi:MAG TPA: antitoxin AF2212-like protein [Gemmataceae bacterium]|nr:antitoxin AF2212-like protein [Gemmataceae bacterium]